MRDANYYIFKQKSKKIPDRKASKLTSRINSKAKKALFFGCPFSIEIRILSSIISLKCAEFLVLVGIVVLGIIIRDS